MVLSLFGINTVKDLLGQKYVEKKMIKPSLIFRVHLTNLKLYIFPENSKWTKISSFRNLLNDITLSPLKMIYNLERGMNQIVLGIILYVITLRGPRKRRWGRDHCQIAGIGRGTRALSLPCEHMVSGDQLGRIYGKL